MPCKKNYVINYPINYVIKYQMTNTKNITKNSNIKDVLDKHPKTAEVFLAFGLHCVGCMASGFDTIEQGAKIHGFSDDDIKDLLDELNKMLTNS